MGPCADDRGIRLLAETGTPFRKRIQSHEQDEWLHLFPTKRHQFIPSFIHLIIGLDSTATDQLFPFRSRFSIKVFPENNGKKPIPTLRSDVIKHCPVDYHQFFFLQVIEDVSLLFRFSFMVHSLEIGWKRGNPTGVGVDVGTRPVSCGADVPFMKQQSNNNNNNKKKNKQKTKQASSNVSSVFPAFDYIFDWRLKWLWNSLECNSILVHKRPVSSERRGKRRWKMGTEVGGSGGCGTLIIYDMKLVKK